MSPTPREAPSEHLLDEGQAGPGRGEWPKLSHSSWRSSHHHPGQLDKSQRRNLYMILKTIILILLNLAWMFVSRLIMRKFCLITGSPSGHCQLQLRGREHGQQESESPSQAGDCGWVLFLSFISFCCVDGFICKIGDIELENHFKFKLLQMLQLKVIPT